MKSYEKLYFKLFSIPKPSIMLAVSLSLALLLSVLEKRAIYIWILSSAAAVVAIKTLNLKFDVKRVAFFSLFITLLSFPSLLLFGTPVSSAFFFVAIFYFCSEAGLFKTFLATLPVYLLIDASIFTLIALAVVFAMFASYLHILNRDVGGINVRRFVESFVLFWLTSHSHYLEKILSSSAVESSGKVRCLSIGDVRLISTDFHPGPFRNVGGGRLVEKIVEGLSSDTASAIYLHSPTTHIQNPVTAEDVEKIVSAIPCDGESLAPMKPFVVEGRRFVVYCFPFDSIRLMLVSGKEAIDDFRITSPHFVVDCHNAHVRGFEIDGESVAEIQELIDMASSRDSETCKLKYAFIKVHAESESLCGYAAVLLLDYGLEKYALVNFDSNNVNPDFRREVERVFKEMGFTAVVTSTDSHAKTGVRAKVAYKAAGDCSEDWEVLRSLISKCRDVEFSKAECRYA